MVLIIAFCLFVKKSREKLFFAPYGLDNSKWDPSIDVYLPQNYSAENLLGKSTCKVELQRQLGLVENGSVTIVCVSRFLTFFLFSKRSKL